MKLRRTYWTAFYLFEISVRVMHEKALFECYQRRNYVTYICIYFVKLVNGAILNKNCEIEMNTWNVYNRIRKTYQFICHDSSLSPHDYRVWCLLAEGVPILSRRPRAIMSACLGISMLRHQGRWCLPTCQASSLRSLKMMKDFSHFAMIETKWIIITITNTIF